MQANELMIGDWVFLKNGKVLQTCKVTVIGNATQNRNKIGKYVCLDTSDEFPTCIFKIDEISPIPLTAEILEKNGFKKFNFRGIEGQHEWTWWNNTLTNVSLWCRELNDNTKDGWMIRIESPTSSLCVKVEFLHQLQHALRLCGIKKEIEP